MRGPFARWVDRRNMIRARRRRTIREVLTDTDLAVFTGGEMTASGIASAMGLRHSATLHPELAVLERLGLVTSRWESPEPGDRPRRRFYRWAGVS